MFATWSECRSQKCSRFNDLTDTPLTKKVRHTAGVALGRHFAPRNFSAL